MESKEELKRTLGFFPALATVMGSVIGSGVFFKGASVAQATQTTSLFMFVWIFAGVISICAALTGAEMAAAIPETGGMLRYIERGYGKTAAFLLGWAQVMIYFPAEVAALSIVFGTQVIHLLGLSQNFLVPIALSVAILTALLNFLGSRVGGLIQSIAFVMKLIPIILIIIFGILHQDTAQVSLFPLSVGHHLSFFPALGAGLLATMYAYNGWIYVGNIAGELKNPTKDLPRAISIGIVGVMIIYVLINYIFIKVLPISQLSGNEDAASKVAELLFGGIGGKIITIGILISVYGTINGYTMTAMRQPYTLAKEKLFPFWKLLVKVHKGTPIASGVLELILACTMICIAFFSNDGFNLLTDMLVFIIWLFYTLVFIALFLLRKREPDLLRPYKVPLYPIVPAIAILGGLFIICMTLFNDFALSLTGIGATLLGLPIYFYLKKKYHTPSI